MKYNASILATLATTLYLVMHGACAQALQAEPRQDTQTRITEKPSMAVNDNNLVNYGMYQLQPDLIALPQALADRNNTRYDIGNMSLVSRATDADIEQMLEFRRNAVVRNRMTGEVGVVTGNITVLSKPNTDIAVLLQQLNLKIIRSASTAGVYIVQPINDVELLGLLQKINASSLVSTARLDILERKYSNQ